MITPEQVDEYFAERVGGETWRNASAAQRLAAVTTANDDVAIELGVAPNADNPLYVGAVAEQALFLLAPGGSPAISAILSGESIDGIGSRSYNKPTGNVLLSERSKAFIRRIRRGSGGRVARG